MCASAPIHVLDVGCHSGLFLAGLPDACRKHGVEPSASAASEAARRGVVLVGRRVEDVDARARAFDVITMFDVVEHCTDPVHVLRRLLPLLKPGGRLIFSTAMHDAWPWRMLGADHWYMTSPEHVTLVTRRFLRHLRSELGVDVVMRTISHRAPTSAGRLDDLAAVVFWSARRWRSPGRVLRRGIVSVPRFRDLVHLTHAPHTPHLRDHVYVELVAANGVRRKAS
jgi:SAM-dependent methyltransferase